VYGPQPRPRPQLKAPPLWLYWGDLCSKVLRFLSCDGPEVFLPVLWWPATIKVNVVQMLQVVALVITIMRSWSFV
jgi:hypothetical protein